MMNQNDLEKIQKKENEPAVEERRDYFEGQVSGPEERSDSVLKNSPETGERSPVEDQVEGSAGLGVDSEGAGMSSAQGVGQPGIDTTKSADHQEIESILEEDLGDIYNQMNPDTQKEFKEEGEKITVKIIDMKRQDKLNFKKIFKLIFGWLSIIPGVNKFFLKQEAKIKTDKILKEK